MLLDQVRPCFSWLRFIELSRYFQSCFVFNKNKVVMNLTAQSGDAFKVQGFKYSEIARQRTVYFINTPVLLKRL